jgi:co-chaperonin GroES (HSP10)
MLEPLGTYVAVERDQLEEVEEISSGLVIDHNYAQTDREELSTGTVAAVGQDVANLKPGDRVVMKVHLFDEVPHGGKTYLLGKEESITARIRS